MNTSMELGIFSLVTLHMKYYVDYYLNFSLVLDLKFYALREQGRKGGGGGGRGEEKGRKAREKRKMVNKARAEFEFLLH